MPNKVERKKIIHTWLPSSMWEAEYWGSVCRFCFLLCIFPQFSILMSVWQGMRVNKQFLYSYENWIQTLRNATEGSAWSCYPTRNQSVLCGFFFILISMINIFWKICQESRVEKTRWKSANAHSFYGVSLNKEWEQNYWAYEFAIDFLQKKTQPFIICTVLLATFMTGKGKPNTLLNDL